MPPHSGNSPLCAPQDPPPHSHSLEGQVHSGRNLCSSPSPWFPGPAAMATSPWAPAATTLSIPCAGFKVCLSSTPGEVPFFCQAWLYGKVSFFLSKNILSQISIFVFLYFLCWLNLPCRNQKSKNVSISLFMTPDFLC